MKYVSVFIPVYNGERYLEELINAVLAQRLPDDYTLEVLMTDSGSRDKSVDIITSYADKIDLRQIPNSEFGHGKTRQAAIRQAKGEFVLFLTQDATPVNDEWLIHMIEPFFINQRVGCAFGRQIPRPFAPATIKREVSSVFEQFGLADGFTIHRSNSLVPGAKLKNEGISFFSDVNSAVRREIVLNHTPFRDIPYGEDQTLAHDMFVQGYLKAYTPQGAVWHSNEYSAKEYFYRKFDEYTALIDTIGYDPKPSKRSLTVGWLRPTLADWSFIRHDREYGKRHKLKHFLSAPAYNFYHGLGKYSAQKNNKDLAKRDELSLEKRRKRDDEKY